MTQVQFRAWTGALLLCLAACSDGVEPVDPTTASYTPVGLSLNTPSVTLESGEATQLVALAGRSAEFSSDQVTWTSSDPAVAQVDASGRVLAVSPGVVEVTARRGAEQVSAVVSVPVPGASEGLALTPSDVQVAPGGKAQLDALLVDEQGVPIDQGTIDRWEVSDPSVATVRDGTITALAEGETEVIAISGGQVAKAQLRVVRTSVTALSISSLNPPSVVAGSPDFVLRVIGSGYAWHAQVNFGGKEYKTTYVSSTELNVLIPAAAVATSGPRTVTVGDRNGTQSNAMTFTVGAPVSVARVDVAPTSASLVVGDSVQFSATPRDANGTALGTTVTWSTSAGAVATVDGSGKVRAVGAGTAIITAVSGGVTGSAQVTVTSPNAVPTVTSLSPSSVAAGSAAFTLRVLGTGFVSGSVVRWNGATRTTTFVSATEVRASIPATDVASVGAAPVSVATPAPGGGTSSALTFTVTAPTVAVVTVTPDTAKLVVGDSAKLNATAKDALGTTLAGKTATWASSNAAVATVNATGTVKAVAAGVAVVTGTIDGKAASATVQVSAAPTLMLPAPTGLIASAVSSSQINLSWNPVTGAASYVVYRGTTQIQTVSTTSAADAALQPATQYSYTVRARDAAGNLGATSSTASATTFSVTTATGSCPATSGRCFYIALNGTAAGNGSASSPFATFAQAAAVLRAGDVLYYRAGTYSSPAQFIQYSTNLNAAAGERITIRSYPGERAIFDNLGNNGSLAMINGQGAIVEGFEFRNSSSQGVKPTGWIDGWTQGVSIRGAYTTFRNNWVHDIVGDPVNNGGSLRVQDGTHVTISNNAFTDLRMPSPISGARHNVDHVILFYGSYNLVHSNYFSHNQSEGQGCVYQKHGATGPGTSFYNNTFDNCAGMGVNINGTQPITVRGNLFINSRAGAPVDGAANVTWEYNTFYGSKLSMFETKASPHTFRNNIVFQNVTSYVTTDGQFTLRISHYGDDAEFAASQSSSVFQNNCYFNPNLGFKVGYFSGTPGTTGGAYTLAQMKGLGKESGSVEANPLFLNVAGNDFRLGTGSPCAAMGVYANGSFAPPLTPAAARGW